MTIKIHSWRSSKTRSQRLQLSSHALIPPSLKFRAHVVKTTKHSYRWLSCDACANVALLYHAVQPNLYSVLAEEHLHASWKMRNYSLTGYYIGVKNLPLRDIKWP